MSTTITENNKRIAKNTLMLYIRMFLSMAIAIYTSRVILDKLGVVDYGIYNVVGGIVALFSFINNSMSGATSRFLTYELGTGNLSKLIQTFRATFTIHLLLAIVLFIIAETVGVWILNTQLTIPIDKMESANWAFQFSILTACLSICQVPFNASIIAHEKMNFYAYVEIVNVVLKLVILYLLVIFPLDRLIVYAALVLCVHGLIFLAYFIFTKLKFNEISPKLIWNKSLMAPILSFSGWDLYGYFGVVTNMQGTNLFLNAFLGPVVNAANGIALQVQSAVNALATNLIMAVRPQIVKSYAGGDISYMNYLLYNISKYATLLLSCITVPLVINMPFILDIWLKEVPQYTIEFCRLALISNCIQIINLCLNCAIHATGKMKFISSVTGSMYLLTSFISYLCLRNGMSPQIVYVNQLLCVIVMVGFTMYTLKKGISQFSILDFFSKVVFKDICIILISMLFPLIVYYNIEQGWLCLIVTSAISVISMSIFIYFIGMSKSEKRTVFNFISSKFNK